MTPLTATTLDGLPAQEFTAVWGDTVRRFVLAERGRWLYRVVYDPRSRLQHRGAGDDPDQAGRGTRP